MNAITQKNQLLTLLWIMFLDHTCLNVYMPIYTLLFFDPHSTLFNLGTNLQIRSFWFGICLGIPRIGNLFFAPLLSGASDRIGRKKILLLGMLGATLFASIIGIGIVLNSLLIIILGCIIQGLLARSNPTAQAVIADISTEQNKINNLGLLLFAISCGAFLGPLLGGFLVNLPLSIQFNYALPFFIAALLGLVAFCITFFVFPETSIINKNNNFSLKEIKILFFKREIFNISICLIATQFCWSLYFQSISPILKQTFQFTSKELGLFMSLIAIFLMISSISLKYLEKYFSPHRLFLVGLSSLMSGLLLNYFLCIFRLTKLIWVSALPVAFGDLVSYICLVSFYSNIVPPKDQGKVMGICFIVVSLIWAVTGVLNGVLLGLNVLLPLLIAPSSILFLFIFLFYKLKPIHVLVSD